MNLDAAPPSAAAEAAAPSIDTGVMLLDMLFRELRAACAFHFSVRCRGDTYIDDHHTTEDVSITLGQCIGAALGSKAGVRRMACAVGTAEGGGVDHEYGGGPDIARVRCVLDLSNRPHFESDLPLDEEYVGGDAAFRAAMEVPCGTASSQGSTAAPVARCGRALTCEMLFHTLDSLVVESRSTAHLQLLHGDGSSVNGGGSAEGHTLELAIAAVRALGAAFAECARVDPRRAGKVASSKGTLSQ